MVGQQVMVGQGLNVPKHTCMLATEVFTALLTSTFDLRSFTEPHTRPVLKVKTIIQQWANQCMPLMTW